MLWDRLRPPGGAVFLACGSFILFQADGGVTSCAQAQSREVLIGLSGSAAAGAPTWSPFSHRHNADRQAARDLDEARAVLALGHVQAARRRLELLVARYPDAAASNAARRELARLYSSPVDRTRSDKPAGHLGYGPAGMGADDRASGHLPVSLGPQAPREDALVQNIEDGVPRIGPSAEQDFRLHVGDRVFFDDRSADLGSRARALLSAQAQWLKRLPRATIVIEGHADDNGSADFNQDLAVLRARAVRDRLIAEGVEAGRITLATYGRERPVALCKDGTCAAQNRRVVTVLQGARSAGGRRD